MAYGAYRDVAQPRAAAHILPPSRDGFPPLVRCSGLLGAEASTSESDCLFALQLQRS